MGQQYLYEAEAWIKKAIQADQRNGTPDCVTGKYRNGFEKCGAIDESRGWLIGGYGKRDAVKRQSKRNGFNRSIDKSLFKNYIKE